MPQKKNSKSFRAFKVGKINTQKQSQRSAQNSHSINIAKSQASASSVTENVDGSYFQESSVKSPVTSSTVGSKVQSNNSTSKQPSTSMMQLTSIRESLASIQNKVDAGMIPGVTIKLIDMIGCRFVAECHDSKSNNALRIVVSFFQNDKLCHVPEFAVIPIQVHDFNMRETVEVVRRTLERLIARRSHNLIEDCLLSVVSLLSQENVDEIVGERAHSSSSIFELDFTSDRAKTSPEIAQTRVQPCPRYSGATFSGPDLLVYFNSAVSNCLDGEVPRTYSALNEILRKHTLHYSGSKQTLDVKPNDEESSESEEDSNEAGVSEKRLTEELVQHDLYDKNLRTADVTHEELEPSHSSMNAKRSRLKIELSSRVDILDASILSGLSRYLGVTCPMSPLGCKNDLVTTTMTTKTPRRPSREYYDSKYATTLPLPSSIDDSESLETLLCWYDDFADVEKSTGSTVFDTNTAAARTIGRDDLVTLWRSMSLFEKNDELDFHYGRFVKSLFIEYSKLRDVQTLGLLAISISKRFGLQQTILPQSSLDGTRLAYASLLHRWGLNVRRTEILQGIPNLKGGLHESHDRDNLVLASPCGHMTRDDPVQICDKESCKKLRGSFVTCAICHNSVRGLGTFCPNCGHGGHHSHMNSWFSQSSDSSTIPCPTGCGCFCGETVG